MIRRPFHVLLFGSQMLLLVMCALFEARVQLNNDGEGACLTHKRTTQFSIQFEAGFSHLFAENKLKRGLD